MTHPKPSEVLIAVSVVMLGLLVISFLVLISATAASEILLDAANGLGRPQ